MTEVQEVVESTSKHFKVKPRSRAGHIPSVSVVICCHNYARFLPQAVRSCILQQDVRLEIIIVDDASTDDSVSVARTLRQQHDNVILIEHTVNTGPVEAFNDGARRATGEFLVRLDADDLLTPGSLSRATCLAQSFPSVGLVYGHPLHFSQLPLPKPRLKMTAWTIWPGREWLAGRCRSGKNVITSPEVLMRRSLVAQLGYLSPLAHSHDMELWLRLSAFADVAYIHGADQAWHREHSGSLSARYVDDLVDFRERVAAFEVLFDGPAGKQPGAFQLNITARETLAKEALWTARHQRACGGEGLEVNQWLQLAEGLDPSISADMQRQRLHRRSPFQTLHPMLRPGSVALRLRGRIRSELGWRRWHRMGVF